MTTHDPYDDLDSRMRRAACAPRGPVVSAYMRRLIESMCNRHSPVYSEGEPAMTLPPELLRLLGDDATPERAADSFAACAGELDPRDADASDALDVWQEELAAAAIRECEARRACVIAKDQFIEALQREADAAKAYDALRNWKERKP